MAKDPAFLFYPGDWLGGTMYMNQEQKGAYMDLLMLQFNVGKFTVEQAKQVLSICFASVWHVLEKKFETDGTFFWNNKLELEITKRRKFSESRRTNASSPKTPVVKKKKTKAYAQHMNKHMHKHMENENENENENVIENRNENELQKGGVGEKPKTLYQNCLDLYFEFIKKKIGAPPDMDGTQGKAMNGIIEYLQKIKPECTDEDVLRSWKYILGNWQKLDAYLSNKLKLTDIKHDITNIINQIKNPKLKPNGQKTQEEKLNEYAELDSLANQYIAAKNHQ